jgi:hypothetical protein
MNRKRAIIISVIVIILIIAFLLLRKMTNKKKFHDDLINFVLRMEGGISDDKRDTASSFPLKGSYLVKGKTYVDPHTNKGITYRTFSDSLGTKATPNLFLEMPSETWLDIFNTKYYSKAKGITGNELLDSYLALWFWGGWNKNLMPTSKVASAVSTGTTKEKLRKLVDLRIEYFNNIVKNNASQSVYLKGWTNRANDFYKEFEKYA